MYQLEKQSCGRLIGVEMLNTLKVKEKTGYSDTAYKGAENPIVASPVIRGYFYKENLMKEMAIKKLNSVLCGMLLLTVAVTFVGYYFEMSNEITLNTLSRQVTALNDENSELQNKLDKLKSFNNIDNRMSQQNILQKAENVMEVPAVISESVPVPKTGLVSAVDWAVGY